MQMLTKYNAWFIVLPSSPVYMGLYGCYILVSKKKMCSITSVVWKWLSEAIEGMSKKYSFFLEC